MRELWFYALKWSVTVLEKGKEGFSVFELVFDEVPSVSQKPVKRGRFPLPGFMLLRNAQWFCMLRWAVLSLLLVFGVLTHIPVFVQRFGLVPSQNWGIYLAIILCVSNLFFIWHLKHVGKTNICHGVKLNLWTQIAIDLILLMIVVHYSGSLKTYLPFTYLFHIVLSCIFFSRPESFLVTVFASVLLSGSVYLDSLGIFPSASLFEGNLRSIVYDGGNKGSLLSIVIMWFIVWFLASHLSKMLREREFKLVESNARLEAAQMDKTRHMLRTTHELKAPFAAIHANTQFLLKGYCGELSEKAVEVLNRIAARSRRLTNEIQEMLQLANLKAAIREDLSWGNVDIAEALEWCVGMVTPFADERKVKIDQDFVSVTTTAVDDYVKMLLGNLISNAVTYSHEGGTVKLVCRNMADNGALVTIRDEGIGIPPEKLPRIFDEYYRTDEATQHNKASSGLGLSIVRDVAKTHGIHVRVESAPGFGTTIFLKIPKNTQVCGVINSKEEIVCHTS